MASRGVDHITMLTVFQSLYLTRCMSSNNCFSVTSQYDLIMTELDLSMKHNAQSQSRTHHTWLIEMRKSSENLGRSLGSADQQRCINWYQSSGHLSGWSRRR